MNGERLLIMTMACAALVVTRCGSSQPNTPPPITASSTNSDDGNAKKKATKVEDSGDLGDTDSGDGDDDSDAGPSLPAPAVKPANPTPGSPQNPPGTPAPGPTTPAPGPTAPAPGPTAPAPGPTTPAPAPTTPAPGPTTPAPAPMTPAPSTDPQVCWGAGGPRQAAYKLADQSSAIVCARHIAAQDSTCAASARYGLVDCAAVAGIQATQPTQCRCGAAGGGANADWVGTPARP